MSIEAPSAAVATAGEASPGRKAVVGRRQIPALTGLRFFAAFFILIAHAGDWIAQFQDSDISKYISVMAIYGMPLFFVLSGFVIHYNYRDLFIRQPIARAICEFAAARFARLYPLFFVFFLLAVAVDSLPQKLYNAPDLMLPILGYYLTLTQSWWYIIYQHQSIIYWIFSVSWSISTEMYFYLVYAVLVFALLAICRRGRAFYAGIAYALLVACGLWLIYDHLPGLLARAERFVPDYLPMQPAFEHSFYRWLFYFSPYVRVLEFILGCLTAEAFIGALHKDIAATEQRLGNIALAGALGFLVILGLLYQGAIGAPIMIDYVRFSALNFLCAPAIAVVMFCVARYQSRFARLMAAPAMVALGETSYSIYLVHSWTLRLFERPAPSLTVYWGADTVWRILCGVGFTLLVSYATYRLIEVPARTRLRRGLRRVIAVVFDRSRQRPFFGLGAHPVPRLHLPYTMAGLALLPTVAVVGQAMRSETVQAELHRLITGSRPEIEVVSASYGANCLGFQVAAPFSNLAAVGNATGPARQICNGRQSCDLEVSLRRFADPVHGCGKEFSVTYRCAAGEPTRSAFASAEAMDKHVLLQCNRAEAPAQP
jgi:peptidoglycan/LPS O-acetylase OafA/YrhL